MFFRKPKKLCRFDRRLQIFETALFFIGWTILFLAGADFPPPAGFLWLIGLIVLLDAVQYRYLFFLLPDIARKPTFLFNCLFFSLGGGMAALMMMLFSLLLENHPQDLSVGQNLIWTGIVTLAAFGYGTIFWCANWIIQVCRRRQKMTDPANRTD